MFRRTLLITASVLALSVAAVGQVAWAAATDKEVQEALSEFNRTNAKIKSFMDKSHGYAVFPSVAKGGLGIGGAHGDGLVYQNGKVIGATSLSQVSIGFQAGGQVFREIIVFQTKESLDRFKGGNFEFDAKAGGVAVTASTSFDTTYENGIAIFTMAKGGLMYEATVGGQKFTFEAK